MPAEGKVTKDLHVQLPEKRFSAIARIDAPGYGRHPVVRVTPVYFWLSASFAPFARAPACENYVGAWHARPARYEANGTEENQKPKPSINADLKRTIAKPAPAFHNVPCAIAILNSGQIAFSGPTPGLRSTGTGGRTRGRSRGFFPRDSLSCGACSPVPAESLPL